MDDEQARQARADRLMQALEGSGLALWDYDARTARVLMSEAWAAMRGEPPVAQELAPAALLELIHPEDLPALREAAAQLVTGQTDRYMVEVRVRRSDGSLFWVLARGSVVERGPDGRVLRIAGTTADVTQRHETEAALRVARDAAEAANQAKSRFLATMSHEIRTPLNGIVGLAKLLLDETLPPAARQQAELIDSSAQALLELLNDMLDVSKIEAGQMDIEHVPFDLAELLDELGALFRLRAREKGLAFKLHVDPSVPRLVRGDPVRLRQILGNLLGNALKFTEQGWFGLHVGATPVAGGFEMKFVVRDTGPGMSPETQARLFQPFAQGEASTARRYGGTGLGLSIVRQLCDLMGGHVSVLSARGKGSRFAVVLPMEEAAADEVTSHHDLLPDAAPVRILVAEDNITNQVVLLGFLRKLGYTDVTAAPDGLQAVELARGGDFDLILMDCQMPNLDGYEATGRLREAGVRSVVIAMTANALKGDRERCVAAGMDDYLTKPISLRKLGETLAAWTAWSAGRAPRPMGAARPTTDMAPLDMGDLKDRFGEDAELMTVALDHFIEATPRLLNRLGDAVAAQDRAEVARLAHAAKGSSAMVSAMAFSRAAGRLEEQAPTAGILDLHDQVQHLRQAFRDFLQQARPGG
ncbi:ATP-binding protein [Ramlibacter sp.]|uniref:PAS domain-containing hybrid sensor histidine kinase/response regulator n=1 Tax=Ramlibacter sp. TaxID=1917967 RepID=UPI0035B0DA0A